MTRPPIHRPVRKKAQEKKAREPKYRYCLECSNELRAWRFPLCKLCMIAILRRTESLCGKCVSQWK
jgi:hypothetical protein